MATDKNSKPIRKGDEIVLRLTIKDFIEPVPDAVTGEPTPGSCTAVVAVQDINDPASPQFVFRTDHIERA